MYTHIERIYNTVGRNLGMQDYSTHINSWVEWAFEAELLIGSKDTFEQVESTYTSTGATASGTIIFTANPSYNDSITLNGVTLFFRDNSGPTNLLQEKPANTINIKATLAETLDELILELNGTSNNPANAAGNIFTDSLEGYTYTADDTTLTITKNEVGIDGNNGGVSTVSGGDSASFGRQVNDGDVITIRQAGTAEGTISVSGSTVSYNAFTGSHWSRLTDNSKPTILRGTVMETIDEMCDWYHVEFTIPEVLWKKEDELELEGSINPETGEPYFKVGDVKIPKNDMKCPYEKPSNVNEGDTVKYTHEGVEYDAKVVKDGDVKHVKSKISDTADCTNVYGVFFNWDNDDDTVNDMYVNALGTSLVRIHKDQTVSKGDLLTSNGDGTAKKQDDDIIRTKTIGKVLTNIKQETYSDGSYTVPCALYCG